MPIIDKPLLIRSAFRAASGIYLDANHLAGLTAAVPFNDLRDRMDRMRDQFQEGIQPLLDLAPASVVNAEVANFFAGAPTQTYQGFEALRSALIALYTAYDAVFDTLTPVTHTVAGGHQFADIPLAQLATLADEVSAVRAAADPLRI